MKLRITPLVAILFASPLAAMAAQTVIAFNTGQQVTGMTKQCFYEALGNKYTLTVRSIDLCPLNTQVKLNPSTSNASDSTKNRQPASTPRLPEVRIAPPSAITAFKSGERTTGMTKQCVYGALGNTYTKTVSSVELCPLSIRVALTKP